MMSDRNVDAVKRKLDQRSLRGLRKYGVTTERDDLSPADWLLHLQEELLDAAVYIERLCGDRSERRSYEGKVNEQDVKA